MRICSIEGCEKKHAARGFCAKHYRGCRRYGDPLAPIRRYATGTCELSLCDRKHYALGLCRKHYLRLAR